MTTRGRILGAAAGAVGLAAAGAALGVRRQSRAIERRKGDPTPFGSLHSPPMTIVADDGVPLHVEVDELDPDLRQPASPLTVVFCHG
ncbi:MAG TPA: alpha/beta hydrolase, partial [Nocardioides sp.]|nr:alpha/beta hydrolase [Nocardioides sp.]